MTGFSIWLKINRIQQQRSLACWEMKSASLLYSKIDDFINEISKFWVHIMFLENTQCVWVQKISCGPQFRYFVLFGVSSYWLLLPLKKLLKTFFNKVFLLYWKYIYFLTWFPLPQLLPDNAQLPTHPIPNLFFFSLFKKLPGKQTHRKN